MIIDLVACIISGLVFLGSIIGGALVVGNRIGKLEGEVKGHNKRLDDVFTALQTLSVNFENHKRRKK